MVQLTLPSTGNGCSLQDLLTSLRRDWTRSLGDGGHIGTAVSATKECFVGWGRRELNLRERRRVEAYFGAVVRRAVSRSGDEPAREARRRLIAASIEADLRDAGWAADRASAEAARVTSGDSGYRGAA